MNEKVEIRTVTRAFAKAYNPNYGVCDGETCEKTPRIFAVGSNLAGKVLHFQFCGGKCKKEYLALREELEKER